MLKKPSYYTDKNILITGAYGFIGNHLAQYLWRKGANVFAFRHDADPARPDTYAKGNHWTCNSRTIQGDIRNIEDVKRAVVIAQPDFVFHLGAITQVPDAGRLPVLTWDVNVMGTINLLDAVTQFYPKARMVIASSDKYYGRNSDTLTEETAPNPGHPYDTSKAAMEMAVQSYVKDYSIIATIARMGNVFGAGDFNYKRIIPYICRQIYKNEPIVLRSNGKQIREYIHVDAVVLAYLHLGLWLDRNENMSGEVFNFSGLSANAISFCNKIKEMALSSVEVILGEEESDESKMIKIDGNKVSQLLGWNYPSSPDAFRDDVAKTMHWYLDYFKRTRS